MNKEVDYKVLPGNKIIDYDYDAEGNKTYIKDPEGNETNYAYDGLNRLWKVTTRDGTSTYEYYDNGNRKSLTLANGAKTVYEYDTRNLLTKLVNTAVGVSTAYKYDYDPDGLQLYKIEPKGTTNFDYDDLGRIKTVVEPEGRTTTYTYDKSGNRKTQTVTGSGVNCSITYNYNEQNRLIDTIEIRNGVSTVTTYRYDNNGNQTRVTEGSSFSSYGYDNFNQLKAAVLANGIAVNSKYDAFGQRTEKITNEAYTTYYYDGQNVILEIGSSGSKARNVYGINLIARADGFGALYYQYNGHGDVVYLVNGNGTLINEYDYDIFGNVVKSIEDKPNPFRYAGYYYDKETGSYYLRARYYDPEIGRFGSEDPIGSGLNWYTYCENNPITFIDPLGLERVVVSGGVYKDAKQDEGKYYYEFIDAAWAQIGLWQKDRDFGEKITWLIADSGWTDDDKQGFMSATIAGGINVVFASSADEIINYLNSTSFSENSINDARVTDPVTHFSLFSHGLGGDGGIIPLAFNYAGGHETEDGKALTKLDGLMCDIFLVVQLLHLIDLVYLFLMKSV